MKRRQRVGGQHADTGVIEYPRVGFIVTNLSRPAERVVAFYNQRGTTEQWIKEGKNAIKWTQLSCCSFAATDREAVTYARARLGPLVLRPRLRPAAPGRTLGRHDNAAAVQILGNVG